MRSRRSVHRRRAGGDSGAALVEMAFVLPLLFLLVFAIITFGALLSFKQSMTASAAEAARAAAVAPRFVGEPEDGATVRARDAGAQAVGAFDQTCNDGGPLTCSYDAIAACTDTPARQCITVRLEYDYDAEPLLPDLPIISALLPDTISAESVVQLNDAS